MTSGEISKDIPFFKKVTMGILTGAFTDKDTAFIKIEAGISDYYKKDYADYYSKNTTIINNSIAFIKKEFSQNNFPKMKVTYDRYPEHIGHLESDGCFRCHNGSFKADNGRVISHDCNLCHTIVGQGKEGAIQYSSIRENLEFQHPCLLYTSDAADE